MMQLWMHDIKVIALDLSIIAVIRIAKHRNGMSVAIFELAFSPFEILR